MPASVARVMGLRDFLRSWPAAGTAQEKAQALRTLCTLLQDTSPGGDKAAKDEVLQLLLPFARGRKATGTPPNHTEVLGQMPWSSSGAVEQQRLALQALGMLFVAAGPDLPPGALLAAAAAVADALEACCGGRAQPVEDPAASRMYFTVLRALQAVLGEMKQLEGLNVAGIVEALRKLMAFGLATMHPASRSSRPTSARLGSAAPSSSAKSGTWALNGSPAAQELGSSGAGAATGAAGTAERKYKPPHMRKLSLSDNGGGAAKASASASIASSSGWRSDSESDASDAEAGPSDRLQAPRVRMAALAALQALVRCESKSVHPHWTALLAGRWPPPQGPGRRPPASLVELAAADPVPRVRAAAAHTIAALLEGPAQRAYLGIAEARTAMRPTIRGFTTLSASLGQTACNLHDGLLQAAASEADPWALAALLRALATLAAAAPYPRLQDSLLPQVVEAAWALTRPQARFPGTPPTELSSLSAAAFTCLASALSSKAPLPALAQHFLQPPGDTEILRSGCGRTGLVSGDPEASVSGLEREGDGSGCSRGVRLAAGLVSAASTGPHLVRIEGLAALRGLARNYTDSALPHWPAICAAASGALAQTVAAAPSPRPSPRSRGLDSTRPTGAAQSFEERLAHQGLRLLGDVLGSLGCVAGDPEDGDVGGPDAGMPTASDSEVAYGGRQLAALWQDVMERILPQAFQHASPGVRAAGFAVVSAMAPTSLGQLPPASQAALWQACWGAVARDPVPAVRSAAAKALGTLAGSPAVAEMPGGMERTAGLLRGALADSTLSVRVAAGWALANLAETAQRLGGAVAGPSALDTLAQAALAACRDNDKVRSNGMRALGHVLCLALLPRRDTTAPPPPSPQHLGHPPDHGTAWTAGSGLGSLPPRSSSKGAGPRAGSGLGTAAERSGDGARGLGAANAAALQCRDPRLESAGPKSGATSSEAHSVPWDSHQADGGLGTGKLWPGDVPNGAAATGRPESGVRGPGIPSWLEAGLDALQSCLAGGGAKVQWNACYAAARLLRLGSQAGCGDSGAPDWGCGEGALQAGAGKGEEEGWSELGGLEGRLPALLHQLVSLVRTNANYKIRMHAAAALMAPSQRAQYGNAFCCALQALAESLESIEGRSEALPPPEDPSAGPSDAARYRDPLRAQLKATLQHLLALRTTADDGECLAGWAPDRREFLFQLLGSGL